MATRLKGIVRFVDLPPGVPTALAHNLNLDGRAVLPDRIEASRTDVTITASTTQVTVTNNGVDLIDVDVLCERWHTIERVFGADQTTDLVPQPFVPGGSGGGDSAASFSELSITRQPTVEIRIYARMAGSDITGDGTLANPFRTTARAIAAVPTIWDGVHYIVDNTGVNDQLAAPYIMPIKDTPGLAFLDISSILAQPWKAPFRIEATPLLIDSPILTGQSASATNNLRTLVFGGSAFGVNAHVGRMVRGAGLLEYGVIRANTATDLLVTSDLPFTAPVVIEEPSATIELPVASPNELYAMLIQPRAQMVMAGQKILYNQPTASLPALWADATGSEIVMFGCWIEGILVDGGIRMFCENTYIKPRGASTKDVRISHGQWRMRYSFATNISWQQYGGGDGDYGAYGSAITDCTPFGHGGNNEPTNAFELRNCLIDLAKTDGINFFGGNRCSVRDTIISNCIQDAIDATGQGLLELNNVQGAGNGAFGCRIQRGASVRRQGLTAVTGATADTFLGGAGNTAWPGATISDLASGTPQGCFIYFG